MVHIGYGPVLKRVPALFFRTATGGEPVRDFLTGLPAEDRRLIGRDIAKVEFGWPIGMPVARALGGGLHEVRTALRGNRIMRVFFFISGDERMVLVHAFLKKTRATPDRELTLARRRMREFKSNERG
jgi:phage-related protein